MSIISVPYGAVVKEVRSTLSPDLSLYLNWTIAEPQVKPPPKATIKQRWLVASRLESSASSNARGIDAAAVFPKWKFSMASNSGLQKLGHDILWTTRHIKDLN